MIDQPSQQDRVFALASSNLQMLSENRERAQSPEASQIRAARALLNWSDDELAKASGLTANFIGKVQTGAVRPSKKAMKALQEAFNAAGVILLPSGVGPDDGLGVRLKRVISTADAP